MWLHAARLSVSASAKSLLAETVSEGMEPKPLAFGRAFSPFSQPDTSIYRISGIDGDGLMSVVAFGVEF